MFCDMIYSKECYQVRLPSEFLHSWEQVVIQTLTSDRIKGCEAILPKHLILLSIVRRYQLLEIRNCLTKFGFLVILVLSPS